MVSQEIVDEPELKNITKAFLLKQICNFIYRCATATLPLTNSKVTAAQQQPYSCAAVNRIACNKLGKRRVWTYNQPDF